MSTKNNPHRKRRRPSRGPPSSLAAFGLCKVHQVVGEIRILTGTNAEHQRTIAILCDISVSHRAVKIDALACAQSYGRVELQMDFDAAFQDKDEFLALMSDRLSKFSD